MVIAPIAERSLRRVPLGAIAGSRLQMAAVQSGKSVGVFGVAACLWREGAIVMDGTAMVNNVIWTHVDDDQ